MYSVKNHKEFAKFDYPNELNPNVRLGNVVIKKSIGRNTGEIGVVIQTFADGDFRTDMYGITDSSDSKPATREEVLSIRPELLKSF